jgi:hypothetical protein
VTVPRFVALYPINDGVWAGSFLALGEDGSLSRVQPGFNEAGQCVKVTPLPVVVEQ